MYIKMKRFMPWRIAENDLLHTYFIKGDGTVHFWRILNDFFFRILTRKGTVSKTFFFSIFQRSPS